MVKVENSTGEPDTCHVFFIFFELPTFLETLEYIQISSLKFNLQNKNAILFRNWAIGPDGHRLHVLWKQSEGA